MKINIVDDVTDNDSWLNDDGTAKGAFGGTERVRNVLNERLDPDLKDKFKIIHSRFRPSFLEKDKKHIMLFHDTFQDPEVKFLSNRENWNHFEKFVFVSHYQKTTYELAFNLPPEKCVVMRNAIDPIEDIEKSTDQIRLIYHTTPHRGLDILYNAFNLLHKELGNKVHLDVFSSFEIYNRPEQDQAYKPLFDALNDHGGITYHGTQPNDVVREYLARAHIFAYPCTWEETSCIAALEAMSAGCHVICPDLGALPETTSNFAIMYPYTPEKVDHANKFYRILRSAVEYHFDEGLTDKLMMQKVYIDSFYNWDLRISEWDSFLRSLS